MEAVAALLQKAGPLGWVILLCSVAAAAIALERAWVFRRVRLQDPGLLHGVREKAAAGDLAGAASLAGRERHPLAVSLAHVLGRADRGCCTGRAELEKAVSHTASREVRRLERFLPTLALIAQVAPLLGLLGTVTGMIEAFRAIEALGGKVNASVLAGGIWEALLTTALGLAVAIPTTVVHNAFQGRVHALVADLKDEAGALFDLLEDGGRLSHGHGHAGREARGGA
ncbi:MAG: MotA/TolQ/ExbB proton channel family protein [Thermodesulfobacteriota bacterium]